MYTFKCIKMYRWTLSSNFSSNKFNIVLIAAVLQKFDPHIINGEDVALGEIPYQVSCDSLSVKSSKSCFLISQI